MAWLRVNGEVICCRRCENTESWLTVTQRINGAMILSAPSVVEELGG